MITSFSAISARDTISFFVRGWTGDAAKTNCVSFKIVFINYKNFEKKVPNFVRKLKTLNENLISEGSSNIIEFM